MKSSLEIDWSWFKKIKEKEGASFSLGLLGRPYEISNERRLFGAASRYWAVQIEWGIPSEQLFTTEDIQPRWDDNKIAEEETVLLLTEREFGNVITRGLRNREDFESYIGGVEDTNELLGKAVFKNNEDPRPAALKHYWYVLIEFPYACFVQDSFQFAAGNETLLLLTPHEMEGALYRSARNPEDIISFLREHSSEDLVD